MTIWQIIAGQLALIAGAIITAFTIIKLHKEYQAGETERSKAKAAELKAGKTEIASLHESIDNLKSERKRLVDEYEREMKELNGKLDKLEELIKDGNEGAINECREMRKTMDAFISDTLRFAFNQNNK